MAGSRIRDGSPADAAVAAAREAVAKAGFRIDYIALRNANSLAPVADLRREPLRLLAAAWLGKTRLIDNVAVKNPA
jgi:pantoate--beta-alanine ligase